MDLILAAVLLGATPGDPLATDPPAADRGEVRTGPPLVQTFALTHRGAAGVLRITGADASCGCLQPAVSRTELNPGEQAVVTLTMNTLTQPAGPNVWRATVRYRHAGAAAESAVELRVSARLIPEVTVTPPALAVSTSGEASHTVTVTVTDHRDKPLTVLSASATSPHLSATLPPGATLDGRRAQPVHLTVSDTFPVGNSDETLVLLTDDPSCRELRVPVRVVKRPPGGVAATPAVINVHVPRGQPEASRLVQVRGPSGSAVRIERVEAGHPQVRAKWSDAPGVVATVRVTVSPTGDRSGASDVRVILAEPPGQVVVVPVTWSVP